MESFLNFVKQDIENTKNNIEEKSNDDNKNDDKLNDDNFDNEDNFDDNFDNEDNFDDNFDDNYNDDYNDKIIKKDKFSFDKRKKTNQDNFNEFFLRQGDFVRVFRTPRKYKVDSEGNIEVLEKNIRLCDLYCGYIGEIRHFFKGDSKAIVILQALNKSQKINFPIECLEKIY